MKKKEEKEVSGHIRSDVSFVENVSVGEFSKEIMQLDEDKRKELVAYTKQLLKK